MEGGGLISDDHICFTQRILFLGKVFYLHMPFHLKINKMQKSMKLIEFYLCHYNSWRFIFHILALLGKCWCLIYLLPRNNDFSLGSLSLEGKNAVKRRFVKI